MSEKEKQILETIATAIPKMSDFDKGYLFMACRIIEADAL